LVCGKGVGHGNLPDAGAVPGEIKLWQILVVNRKADNIHLIQREDIDRRVCRCLHVRILAGLVMIRPVQDAEEHGENSSGDNEIT